MSLGVWVGGDASLEETVDFRASGERAKGEFRCSECGYGVTVWKTLPLCPMCGGEVWEESAWRPFSRNSEL